MISLSDLITVLPIFLLHFCFFGIAKGDIHCPKMPSGVDLYCATACCISNEGIGHGYYCCDSPNGIKSPTTRVERFVAAYTPGTFQIDYTLLVLGLIISIILSVLLSFFCCLLCNGCWLHRRRNPHMYENVNDDGFYPICCGFGIPMGTVVFSTHPPQFRGDEMYGGSSLSGASRGRVRFNEDGTPRGVLKNGNGN
uniref:Uncharacterized protein n=1 Tax=Meloidogyne enterolobii TaxID=390850 RepID=A0A6V7XMU0_MELEN|nr:unnamed protein product [Meloidogyne enterolobii]